MACPLVLIAFVPGDVDSPLKSITNVVAVEDIVRLSTAEEDAGKDLEYYTAEDDESKDNYAAPVLVA